MKKKYRKFLILLFIIAIIGSLVLFLIKVNSQVNDTKLQIHESLTSNLTVYNDFANQLALLSNATNYEVLLENNKLQLIIDNEITIINNNQLIQTTNQLFPFERYIVHRASNNITIRCIYPYKIFMNNYNQMELVYTEDKKQFYYQENVYDDKWYIKNYWYI